MADMSRRSLIRREVHPPDIRRAEAEPEALRLVRERTTLHDAAQVQRYLPDIIGRALARSWIDPIFRQRFGADPKGTLLAYDVVLPETIAIDYAAPPNQRPEVIVREISPTTGRGSRLLFLRLVMVAGR